MSFGLVVLLLAGAVGYLAYILFHKQRRDLNAVKARTQGITCDKNQCAIQRQLQVIPSSLQSDLPFAVMVDLSNVPGAPSTDTPLNSWGGLDVKFNSDMDPKEAGAGLRAVGTDLAVVSKTKDFPGTSSSSA